MPYLTNYQYYSNAGVSPTNVNHGSYQYVSLADIVRNFMFAYVGPDKVIDNVDRSLVRFHAKQAVKQLNMDALKEIKVLEAYVGSDLKLVMPHDYVNYVRISLLLDGVLYPMHENLDVMSAKRYLYDNNMELQFDVDGVVLYDSSSNLDDSRLSGDAGLTADDQCCVFPIGSRLGDDPSRMNVNPKFRVNKQAGVFDFDSQMSGQTVIIEYVSDGMEGGVDSEIMINKEFEQYMYARIKYVILSNKFGTPVMTKDEARKESRAEYRNARIRANKLNPATLLMTLRGQQKWNR